MIFLKEQNLNTHLLYFIYIYMLHDTADTPNKIKCIS